MKTQPTIQVQQLETVARFLEEHPSFSPLLAGSDALVCGFLMGECVLACDEMELLWARLESCETPPMQQIPVPAAISRRRLS